MEGNSIMYFPGKSTTMGFHSTNTGTFVMIRQGRKGKHGKEGCIIPKTGGGGGETAKSVCGRASPAIYAAKSAQARTRRKKKTRRSEWEVWQKGSSLMNGCGWAAGLDNGMDSCMRASRNGGPKNAAGKSWTSKGKKWGDENHLHELLRIVQKKWRDLPPSGGESAPKKQKREIRRDGNTDQLKRELSFCPAT